MDARVDITRLQLLNDRINQCLEALEQVRATVTGINPLGAQAIQQEQVYGQQQVYGQPVQGFVHPMMGLQHTSAPWINQPMAAYGYPQGAYASNFQGLGYAQPWQRQAGLWPQGLGHSTATYERSVMENLAADPHRIRQTFPFLRF